MLSVAFGLLASLALVRGRFRGRAVLRAFFLTPMVLPVIILAVALYAAFLRLGINGTLTTGAIGAEALSTMTATAVDEKIGWVRAAQGDRDIELNVRAFFVAVTDDRAGSAAAVAGMIGFEADW